MSNFLIIIFCLLVGYAMRKTRLIRADGYKIINTWIIYIGLPATSFRYLPSLQWDHELLLLLVSPLFILIGSILFIASLRKPLNLSRRSAATLMLVSGFSNTSFVGFPLVTAYFGAERIGWAIISDQATFFLLSAVGTVIAIRGRSARPAAVPLSYLAKRVFTFPPLLGCLAALLLSAIVDLNPLKPFFGQLSSTVSPLALFSIGMQLSFGFCRAEMFAISLSLGYKLLLGPLLLLLVCYGFGIKGDIAQVGVFEMAMPSLVATSLLLEQFKLNNKLGNAVIGFSILIGLITSWIGYQCIILLL